MTEPAAVTPSGRAVRKLKVIPWERRPGENDLWRARFLRYVALGPSRSVSLVATGRRNAYPIPAHWPIVSKQNAWKERAEAFDAAAKLDPSLIVDLNVEMTALADNAPNGEREKLRGVTYQPPPPDEDSELD